MTTPTHNERMLLGELAHALAALEKTTGVKGRIVALESRAGKGRRADALIDIHTDGKKHRYAVEAKVRVNRLEALGQIKAQLDQTGARGLLFAPYLTAAIARQCRQLDIPFLDLAGNAYLHEPGLHVYVTGEKPAGPVLAAPDKAAGGTATASRIMFALLCKPALLQAPYRELAAAANVALGAIGGVFADLETRGLIAGIQKARTRRLLEPGRLLDEWVTNYPIRLRPKLHARRFRAEHADWWKQADLAGLHAGWSGDIAAHRLTRHLKPASCTVYLMPSGQLPALARLTRFVAANRLRADPQGGIEILDAFWHWPPAPGMPGLVPPLLAYADLIATLDPRRLEAAKIIREQFIEHGLSTA